MHSFYRSILGQGLPPIQPGTGFDVANFLLNAVAALLWSVVAAIIFTGVVILAMRIFSWLTTPELNEFEELKKGNVAVAAVMVSFILAVSAVVVAVLLK